MFKLVMRKLLGKLHLSLVRIMMTTDFSSFTKTLLVLPGLADRNQGQYQALCEADGGLLLWVSRCFAWSMLSLLLWWFQYTPLSLILRGGCLLPRWVRQGGVWIQVHNAQKAGCFRLKLTTSKVWRWGAAYQPFLSSDFVHTPRC